MPPAEHTPLTDPIDDTDGSRASEHRALYL